DPGVDEMLPLGSDEWAAMFEDHRPCFSPDRGLDRQHTVEQASKDEAHQECATGEARDVEREVAGIPSRYRCPMILSDFPADLSRGVTRTDEKHRAFR